MPKNQQLKDVIASVITIVGLIMIAGIPYSVYSGSFLSFVTGCFGFVIMMKGLFMNMPINKGAK